MPNKNETESSSFKSRTKELRKRSFVNTSSEASNDTYPMLLLLLLPLLYIFLLLLRRLFENKCDTKMKLKVSREWTEQKNVGSTDHK